MKTVALLAWWFLFLASGWSQTATKVGPFKTESDCVKAQRAMEADAAAGIWKHGIKGETMPCFSDGYAAGEHQTR